MNDSGILPPCPACADSAVWSCFTPRSDLRQRRDKAWHSALWLSLGLSCPMSCYLWLTRDAFENTKTGRNPSDIFFHRFHFAFYSLFDVGRQEDLMVEIINALLSFRLYNKIFVVRYIFFFIRDVILQFPSQRNATAQRLGLTMVYPMWH